MVLSYVSLFHIYIRSICFLVCMFLCLRKICFDVLLCIAALNGLVLACIYVCSLGHIEKHFIPTCKNLYIGYMYVSASKLSRDLCIYIFLVILCFQRLYK